MPPYQEINALEDVLDEILSILEKIIQSGEVLSDDLMLAVAEEINAITERIEELRSQEPIEAPTPQLEPGPYPSSNINSFKYDPESKMLWVKFHGKDTADSGPTYSYEGIPKFIYEVFRRGAVGPKTSGQNKYHRWIKGVTPSLGAAMHALVKNGGYPYQRVA